MAPHALSHIAEAPQRPSVELLDSLAILRVLLYPLAGIDLEAIYRLPFAMALTADTAALSNPDRVTKVAIMASSGPSDVNVARLLPDVNDSAFGDHRMLRQE